MRTVAEQLRAAKRLIEDPRGWWSGGKSGSFVHAWLGRGHCPVIAIQIAADSGEGWDATLAVLARALGWESSMDPADAIWDFNESHSHAEVMAAFDRAIELAESPSGSYPEEKAA